MQLHGQLDHYLSRPERIYSSEPLANARQLLNEVGDAASDEPRLVRKLAALQRQVELAAIPVDVELQSDGQYLRKESKRNRKAAQEVLLAKLSE